MTAILMFTPVKSKAGGRVLESLRLRAKYSPVEMAAYLGYTRKQVENWEKGESPIRRAIVIGYATAAGVDPERAIDVAIRAIDGGDVSDVLSEWRPRQDSNLRPRDYRCAGQLTMLDGDGEPTIAVRQIMSRSAQTNHPRTAIAC